jgi:hypothetical protein
MLLFNTNAEVILEWKTKKRRLSRNIKPSMGIKHAWATLPANHATKFGR